MCSLGVLTSSCTAFVPRIAPVQSARVVQTESFRQRFVIENVVRAERVFRSVLGPENYDALKPDEWVPYVEKLLAGSVEARGEGTLVISIMPQRHDQFFFEGWGHYSVADRESKQILFSGEFTVVDDGPHSMTEFQRGYLDTRVRQSLVRHFALHRPTFIHESELVLRVHIKRIDQDLYILDYGTGHEVGIVNDVGRVEVIGCAEFDDQRDGRKLIDLRGIDFLRDDYAEKLEQAGFEPTKPRQAPTWVDLVACEAGSKGANCACPKVGGSRSP